MVESADLDAFIQKTVADHWEARKVGLLLSQLGLFVRRNFDDAESLMGGKLSDYLRTRPLVQMISYPGVPEKIAVVPLDVRIGDDVTQLFSQRETGARRSTNIFAQTFWDAFFTPMATRRFIVLGGNSGVEVVDSPTPPDSDQFYEIHVGDLVAPNADLDFRERIEATHAKVDAWLARNGIQRSAVEIKKSSSRMIESASRIAHLRAAFEGLNEDDLRRVVIPLDLIIKLTDDGGN